MEATLAVLNRLVEAGLVERYAIGGAVGAIFWIEPFDTIDLDIFVRRYPEFGGSHEGSFAVDRAGSNGELIWTSC
jgi:hypothetical protein